MTTLAYWDAQIPSSLLEYIAVASPFICIVALSDVFIPSNWLSWNTQLLNVADAKLPCTTAPE